GNDVGQRVCVERGSLPEISGSYDLVVVNILARVIVELVEEGLSERMRPSAVLITAGITVDKASEVAGAFERGGLELMDRRQQDDWISLLARRS
ncbi:MAG: 50S ribosomal protein L11 methyltransferase, partial [Chloroflexota bacterium]|nr:50S ribosomal protein L11 methyltransferase [Chloroflexota bacterium]